MYNNPNYPPQAMQWAPPQYQAQPYYGQVQQAPLIQQPQPVQQQRPVLAGRIVGDIAEVTAQEIPMDGSVSVFPLKDFSAIYAKAWNADGTITTIRFEPINANQQPQPDANQPIMDKLAVLEEMIEKLL